MKKSFFKIAHSYLQEWINQYNLLLIDNDFHFQYNKKSILFMIKSLILQKAIPHKIQEILAQLFELCIRSICFGFGATKIMYKILFTVVFMLRRKKYNLSYLMPSIFFLVPQV